MKQVFNHLCWNDINSYLSVIAIEFNHMTTNFLVRPLHWSKCQCNYIFLLDSNNLFSEKYIAAISNTNTQPSTSFNQSIHIQPQYFLPSKENLIWLLNLVEIPAKHSSNLTMLFYFISNQSTSISASAFGLLSDVMLIYHILLN